jgi:tetratricopeptide (TPR) repeat protein
LEESLGLNQVLWTIDNELDGANFERLCVDLLYRNGYRDIVPIEPQDGGRDAEEFPRRGRGRSGEATFFQFSLEKDWKGKVRGDARKLKSHGFIFTTLVFVTSQPARGIDRDSLARKFRQENGWDLIVYSREWLRLQLEEAHPDLAKKYLNIELTPGQRYLSASIRFGKETDGRLSTAWNAIAAGANEIAVVELKGFLQENPDSFQAWKALAWCHYCLGHYSEALASIVRALKLNHDMQALSIRACILAEKGIEERSRPLVLEAQRLFEKILESAQAPTWDIFYNLGNVLSALGEHGSAIIQYQQALQLEEHEACIWKNLASSYHYIGYHDIEMECFNKALELDPLKPETLVSKGISLLVDFSQPEEAASLIERALKSNPDWIVRYPHAWYWLGEAYRNSGSLEKALEWVDDGLAHRPGDLALKRLMSELLPDLLRVYPDVIHKAQNFWRNQIAEEPLDYYARSQLAGIMIQQGDYRVAWELLENTFELMGLYNVVPLRNSRFGPEECIRALEFLPQYAAFRKRFAVTDYWQCDDPLYDLSDAPPITDLIQGALTAFLSIPFGLGFKYLEDASPTRENEETLRNFFDVTRPLVEHAITEAARELSSLIPPLEAGHQEVADKITKIIMFLGLVALREFPRQIGWIASQFAISSEALDCAMERYDKAQIERNVMINSIGSLNEEGRT